MGFMSPGKFDSPLLALRGTSKVTMEFTVHKVPSQTQAVEDGVCWLGLQHRRLVGRIATILNQPFVVKTTKYLTANDVALNAGHRRALHLDIGTSVAFTLND